MRRRPKGAKFWTCLDVERWIAEQTRAGTSGYDVDDARSPQEKARWFLAVRQAEQMLSEYNTREWAEVIMGGLKPITTREVSDWVQLTHEDCEAAAADAQIEKELTEFWRT